MELLRKSVGELIKGESLFRSGSFDVLAEIVGRDHNLAHGFFEFLDFFCCEGNVGGSLVEFGLGVDPDFLAQLFRCIPKIGRLRREQRPEWH